MNILYRKKIFKEINKHQDLELFFSEYNIFKYFRKIPENLVDQVNFKIKETSAINFKGLKKWYRDISNYPETILNKNFLLSMGWEDNEISEFILDRQKRGAKKIAENKIKNPNLYYDKSPKRIEYWLKKGLSIEDAKKTISNSQRTFSKEICIQKYGNTEGEKIFEERQKKWISSLKKNNNIDNFNASKNSYKYNSKNINDLINRSSFLEETKNIIFECINNNTIAEFAECVIGKVDVKSLSDIIPFLNSNVISNHYKIDKKTLKETFISLVSDKLSIGYFGQPVYHKGIRYKSIKEYKLSLLFEEKNIDFIYEKKYPNSHFVSDFYLPHKDLYIEYFGILDGKNIDNLDEKQLIYYDKMIQKILFCEKNKINLIYDTNFNKLCEKIKYENNDKRFL